MTKSGDSIAALRAAVGDGFDPAGVSWAELTPELLHSQRTSVKWTSYDKDVLPMFIAEMDFTIAPEIRRALVERVEASDIGYLDGPRELAPTFADFARDMWNWEIADAHVHLATDVAAGVVEALRVARPNGGRLVLPTPCYPGFFEMLKELNFEVVEVPLLSLPTLPKLPTLPDTSVASANNAAGATLDLAAIERVFAASRGDRLEHKDGAGQHSAERAADAFLLCNPHNPHGVPFSRDELTGLARLAAEYDVFVVSDEIHAPLTHSGEAFTPFAPLAAEAGALSVTATSASKGWNLAGAKCSVIVAADERANRVLDELPREVATRTSILGLHASIAAFCQGREWLTRTIAQIEANQRLLTSLLDEHLPRISFVPARAGYLAWLDLSKSGLGDDPARRVLDEGRVALNDGLDFGTGGSGHARMNLACSPDTIVRAVERITQIGS